MTSLAMRPKFSRVDLSTCSSDVRRPNNCRLLPFSSRQLARRRLTPLCGTFLRFGRHQHGVSGDSHTARFQRETPREGHVESPSQLKAKMPNCGQQIDVLVSRCACLIRRKQYQPHSALQHSQTQHELQTLRKQAPAHDHREKAS